MTPRSIDQDRTFATLPNVRRRILTAWSRDRLNTFQIGKTLGLHEAVVAEVLCAQREERFAGGLKKWRVV